MPAFCPRRFIGFIENVEFKLGCEISAITALVQALHLFFQDGARRMGKIVMMVVQYIAQHNGRLFQPRRKAQRGEIRLHDEIAIAFVPTRRLIARYEFHIDIVGQKIIAAVGFVITGFHEKLSVEALSNQAALHVHDAGQHRVDPAFRDCLLQFVKSQLSGHLCLLQKG
ncbi:hypothetical protein P038_01814 [Brucella abortus 99-9971-135]|nr:hypothetical protein P047_00113 [Brucella abortus 99-9971-159]ERT99356.1 hypothetical protein P038_01814 [Brucella abortus 99-9971-135]